MKLFFVLFKISLFVIFCHISIFAKTHVGKITFVGNSSYSEKNLLDIMTLKPPSFFFKKSTFSHFALQSDIRLLERFYYNQGYISASISYSLTKNSSKNRTNITININEGSRVYITAISIKPNPVINSLDDISLVSSIDSPYYENIIFSDAKKIEDTLAQAGYLKAVVTPDISIDTNASLTTVIFQISSGPRILVDTIIIDGLSLIRESVVKKELMFKKGDTLFLSRINKSLQNIYRTTLFTYVTIKPVLPDSKIQGMINDTAVPIKLQLNQANYFRLETGAGYDAQQVFISDLNLSYGNLFGRGHSILLNTQFSAINQLVKLTYSTPRFFYLPLDFDIATSYERHDTLLFAVPMAYTGEFNNFSIVLGRSNPLRFSYTLSFDWENVIKLSAVTIDSLPTNNDTRSISGDFLYDRRNDIFNPIQGYFTSILLQLAGLSAQSNQFLKGTFTATSYWNYDSTLYGGSSIQFGVAFPFGSTDMIPIQDQFFAGGSRSVRGYPFEQLISTPDGIPLGGNTLLVLKLIDLRFPLYKWFNGAVFIDAGYVWQDLKEFNLKDLKFTAGPGLRVVTPVGIIRCDIGFQLDRLKEEDSWQIHFDIGQAF